MKKTYFNTVTKETTENAKTALQWHKNGIAVEVKNGNKTTYINGAQVETEQERFDRIEGRERCERIAEEIEAYASGKMHKCPECNETAEFSESVGNKFKCPYCESVSDVDEWEELSIYDYLDDVIDVEFTINRFKELQSCEICIGFGGPNIYIDTADAYIKLYWGSTREKYPITYEVNDIINDWAEEYYNCL